MIGQRGGLIRLISDPWPYLTKRCPWNRGLVDRKARAGVGHSIKIFLILSNPIFSSTGRVNSKVPYSGCKAEEEGEWAQPHQQPAFSTRKELKMKEESVFTIYGVEWLSLISSSLSPPFLFAPFFSFLSRRQENPFIFLLYYDWSVIQGHSS